MASTSYVLSTVSDDGVRLWVNGQLVIDNWTDHPATTDTSVAVPLVADAKRGQTTNASAPILLVAGEKYAIRMELQDRGGKADARLRWAYPGRPTQIVPRSRLFP